MSVEEDEVDEAGAVAAKNAVRHAAPRGAIGLGFVGQVVGVDVRDRSRRVSPTMIVPATF